MAIKEPEIENPPPSSPRRTEMADNSRSLPVPDPTLLTTEALMREISHLKELTDRKFAQQTAVLEEVNLRNQQRFESQTKALDAAFLAQQTAVQAALQAAEKGVQTAMVASEKAVSKAEAAAEKRFDAIAEFRAAFNDLVNQQMPRKEAETRLNAMGDKLDSRLTDMNTKVDELRSFSSKSFLIGGIALVISTISVFVTVISFLNLN